VPKTEAHTKEREDTEEDKRDEGEAGRAAVTGWDGQHRTDGSDE
jgi:hypothetical protein